MPVTPRQLVRAAALAGMAGGLVFVGVQVDHPHLDAAAVTTTDWAVRSTLKAAMAALGLAGITGMYLYQVARAGVLGLVGYVLSAVGYLAITGTSCIALAVLPSIAGTDPAFVEDVLAAASGGSAAGDIGLLGPLLLVGGVAYLGGGLLLGVAFLRAGVLARWASVLLSVAAVTSVLLPVMPDSLYRVLAVPNGVAMVGLGWSLWRCTRPGTTSAVHGRPEAAGTGVRSAV